MPMNLIFRGKDGSRAIKSLQIDPSGTGKSFKAVAASTVTKNGDAVRSRFVRTL